MTAIQEIEQLQKRLDRELTRLSSLKEKSSLLEVEYDSARKREAHNKDLVSKLVERQKELNVLLDRAHMTLRRNQEILAQAAPQIEKMAKALPDSGHFERLRKIGTRMAESREPGAERPDSVFSATVVNSKDYVSIPEPKFIDEVVAEGEAAALELETLLDLEHEIEPMPDDDFQLLLVQDDHLSDNFQLLPSFPDTSCASQIELDLDNRQTNDDDQPDVFKPILSNELDAKFSLVPPPEHDVLLELDGSFEINELSVDNRQLTLDQAPQFLQLEPQVEASQVEESAPTERLCPRCGKSSHIQTVVCPFCYASMENLSAAHRGLFTGLRSFKSRN